jgi:hypothetical protein
VRAGLAHLAVIFAVVTVGDSGTSEGGAGVHANEGYHPCYMVSTQCYKHSDSDGRL